MVRAEDVVSICKRLTTNGIQVWVIGGWGIDALLGEQTRFHKDLDVFILLDDVVRTCALLGHDGYTLKELWSENRPAVDARMVETATAFILQSADGCEIDVHAICLDDRSNGVPVWEADEGFIFTREDLAGQGTIGGLPVRCITPEKQMLCHTGYQIPDSQLHDLELLHQKFGVKHPNIPFNETPDKI
jgi:lincosamide nucleotidyltransferase A/C/D/E